MGSQRALCWQPQPTCMWTWPWNLEPSVTLSSSMKFYQHLNTLGSCCGEEEIARGFDVGICPVSAITREPNENPIAFLERLKEALQKFTNLVHTDFSRGRSGGLVVPSLSEFSTVYCDLHKGFGIVNKAEIDVFLELLLF